MDASLSRRVKRGLAMFGRTCAVLSFIASAGLATAAELRTLVDTDNNPATGCTVSLGGGATFTGVESRYATTVDTTQDPPRVTGITRQDCTAAPSTFGAPVAVSGGGWAVGIGNGTSGYNVIEAGLPLPPGVAAARLAVEYSDPAIGADAVVSTSSGGPIIAALVLPDGTPIPTLSEWMLAVLVLLVGAVGWRHGRHRLPAAPLAVLGLVMVTTIAWAAIVLDGQTSDWGSVPPSATDPVDAPAGADIAAVFAKLEGSTLFVRVDARTGMPAAAVADTYAATAGTTLAVPAATGLVANDRVGVPAANVVAFGGGSLGGTVTSHAGGATATFGSGGLLTVNADGSFAFTAAAGFTGAFTFSYRLVNINATTDAVVTITTRQAPAITSANATSFNVGTAGTFTVTATGAPAPTLAMSGALPGGVTFNTSTGVLSGTPAAGSAGTYPLTFTAVNGVSPNATQAFTLTVTDGVAITSAGAATFTTGSAGSFTITTTGSPTAATISISGALPSGVTFANNGNGTATLAGTPAAATGGAYPITITASNGTGSRATQAFTLTVNQAPVFTSVASATFLVGSPGSHTVTATGFPAATFSASGALPAGVTFNPATGVLSGTPSAGAAGTYPLTFTATNAAGAATQTFTLIVNQGVLINSASAATFTVGQAGTFTVTTTATPTAGTITFTGTLPAGVTFTNNGNGTATIAGTPAASTGGSYAITITAGNGIPPDATQAFTLTVNQPPAITSAASTTFTVGTAGSFTVTASGFPAPTFAVTAGTLPGGVTLAANGTLSGTPAAGTGGTHAITLTASNGISPAATQAFTLTVSEAPTITSASTTTFTAGMPGTFTATASGVPAPSFSITTGTLPGGVTLSASGVLSGTPPAGSGGAYPFTLRATNGVPPDASQGFTLFVNQAPAFTSLANATFTVNTASSFTMTASGFPAPGFALTSGSLPAGVTLAANGVLSGTPTVTGTFNFQVTASNGVVPAAIQAFTLTVNDPAVANDDTYALVHDSALVVPAASGVLANDTGTPTPALTSVTGSGAPCSAFPCTIATANGSATVAADGSFSFTPAAGFAGTNTFTYAATNTAGSATATVTLTVTNALPVVDLNGAAAGIDFGASFAEGGGAVAIADAAQLTVTDADDTQLTGATIVITNLLDAGAETLSVTCSLPAPGCQGAINAASVVYTAATGTLEILATAPLADYQALLRTLRYDNTSATPNATPRDITITVNDGTADNAPVAHAIVGVTGVNGAPSITAPATASTPTNTARVFAGTVSVADPDAGTNNVQVTLTATNGVATLSGTTGLSVTGDGTATVTATGPIASQNAALNGMSFTPTTGYSGAASLRIDVSDLGNTGSGGPLTATRTIAITVDDLPRVLSTVPPNGATNVSTTAALTVNFSETVTASTSSFTLQCPAGTPRTFTLSASPAASYTITPSSALPAGSTCVLTVVAAQVTDSLGQNPSADTVASFSTNTLPTVASTTPANGSTGVAPGTAIGITFSEPVSATGAPFTLECPAATPRAFTSSASPATTYTITPSATLPTGTTCVVTVVAAQVTDTDASQAMAANHVFSFTTGVPPAITSANAATFTIGSAQTHTVTTTGTPTVSSITMGSVTAGPGGALPAGVSFAYGGGANATLSGTANNAAHAGTYVLGFTASNGLTPDAVQNPFTLTVSCPTITLAPATGSIFTASYNSAFSQAFAPTGGTAPYTYTLGGAALPGVAFSGNNLAGTPSNTGGFAFTVQAVDQYGCASAVQSYTLNVNPTVVADNYTPTTPLVGNVRATSANAGFSVVANDVFPAGATISAFDATSTLGGIVSMTTSGAGLGQFVYDPPRGVTGADTFTYTLSSNGRTATGTVSLTVANMVWFIDNAAAACPAAPCDGRSARPYTTLAAFQAANTGVAPAPQPGDPIFIATGSGDYTGPLTLRSSQKVFGQGATVALATLAGLTPGPGQVFPATSGTRPNITSAAAATLTLSTGNTLRGFNVGQTTAAGSALSGASIGTFTASEVSVTSSGNALSLANGTPTATFDSVTSTGGGTGVSLTSLAGDLTIIAGSLANNTAGGFSVTGGAGNVSYGGAVSGTAPPVTVASKAAGTVTFSGAIASTGSGISLTNNTGATIAFTGGINLSTGASNAFTATGGGTVTATQNNTTIVNTITTTTGVALNVASTVIGAADLTFRSITAGTAASGPAGSAIVLNSTGSAGGLVVTGNGGSCTVATPTCSGGRIQRAGSDGISLAATDNATFAFMRINNNGGSGIRGNVLNGFVLDSSLVEANGDAAAADESGVYLTELVGSVAAGSNPTRIASSTIRNNLEFEVQVVNTAGTLTDFQLTTNTISSDGATGVHGNLVNFLALGTASMTLNANGGVFTGAAPGTATGLQCDHSGTGGLMRCNATNGTYSNNNVAISVSQANGGALKFDVNANTATGNRSHGLNLFVAANGTAAVDGTFRNNQVGTSGVVGSGSSLGFGIRVQNEGVSTASPVNVLITGNTVREMASFAGINVNQGIAGQATSKTTNVTITNNVVTDADNSRAIIVQQNNSTTAASAGTTCVDISGNEMNNIVGQAGDGTKLRLRELTANGGVMNVRQGPDAAGLAAANSPPTGASTTTTSSAQVSVGGVPSYNQAACTQPAP